MNEIQFEGRMINRRWKILSLLGSGSFGKVFLVWDSEEQDYCAMKIEENKNDDKLKGESKIMLALSNSSQRRQGIPLMRWYGTDTNFSQLNFMVTDILGPNLEDLFVLCNRRFSLKTVLMIADSTISLIEYMHQKSYIHRDIKPENFLVGINNQSHLLYAIDFGLSQRYRDPNTHSHISFRENRPLVGTARYMSINNHLGIEASRRDDLESLGYMLIYFLNGSLPWQGIDSPNKQEKYERIKEKKMKTLVESYCRQIPPEFTIFLNYTRNLIFDEKPDYTFLKKMFDDLYKREGYVRDFCYDWTISSCVNTDLVSKKSLPFMYAVEEEDSHSSQSADVVSESRDSRVLKASNYSADEQSNAYSDMEEGISLNTEEEKKQVLIDLKAKDFKRLDDSDVTDNRPMEIQKNVQILPKNEAKPTIFSKMKESASGFQPAVRPGFSLAKGAFADNKKTDKSDMDQTANDGSIDSSEIPKQGKWVKR